MIKTFTLYTMILDYAPIHKKHVWEAHYRNLKKGCKTQDEVMIKLLDILKTGLTFHKWPWSIK